MEHSRLHDFLAKYWVACFGLMGACFVLFGLMSLNLVQVLRANLSFLAEHGVDAVREGALQQLIELLLSGYAAVACYVVFKLCEKVLVERLCAGRPRGTDT